MWIETHVSKVKNQQIVITKINNIDLIITKNVNQLFAIKDICPHEEIKLSLGCIKNNSIKCSLHGFSFDLITGKCDESGINNLITYPIKQQNNKIWIKIY